jgi:NTE family protein
VLNELTDQGIVPDVVAGTSIGAVVGGSYVAGKLGELEAFARSLTRRRILRLMDVSFTGRDLIGGAKLRNLLRAEIGDRLIEAMPKKFAAIATEVGSGHEIWMTEGDMVEALCASYALPGVFGPVKIGGRWLFDGALVNPIPVTVCRALGADFVIAVNLVSDTMFRGTVIRDRGALADAAAFADEPQEDQPETPRTWPYRWFGRGHGVEAVPGMVRVMTDAFNIAQDRVARSRLAGDPPDILINARLNNIGMFDFNRADELIAFGRQSVRQALPELSDHMRMAVTA